MIRYSVLIDTREFRIGRFDHPTGDCHHDPHEEVNTEYEINRLEQGTLTVEIGRRRWELGPGDLFLCYPGQVYRCRHRESMPSDSCFSITHCLNPESAEERVAFEQAAKRQPVLSATNRLAYLFRLLARASGDAMAIEESVHSVTAEIAHPSASVRIYREKHLAWYAERVDAIRRRLDQHYADDHGLALLARSVGISPFHFARIFRELAGIPPHAYLLRTRLAEAARRLREGASVTEACYSTGFQNLSYFTRQFQRHFGARPSIYACQTSRSLCFRENFKNSKKVQA